MLKYTFVFSVLSFTGVRNCRGAPSGGGGVADGAAGLQPTPHPPNRSLKTTDFVDTVKLNVLRDLPFSRNRPMDSVLEFKKIKLSPRIK